MAGIPSEANPGPMPNWSRQACLACLCSGCWLVVPVAAAAGTGAATAPPLLKQEEVVRLALSGSPALQIARREWNLGRLEAERDRPAFRPEVTATAAQGVRTPRV
ncbi:MAG: hypothetical protein FJX77_13980, partial [Armatimonadetes bacterium]|nr:hypothetical protein [Armatimonadota bacterium]